MTWEKQLGRRPNNKKENMKKNRSSWIAILIVATLFVVVVYQAKVISEHSAAIDAAERIIETLDKTISESDRKLADLEESK